MQKPGRQDDYLSDYERAVCYYTLPKVVGPVTIGLVGAYLACLVEAVALLVYGVATGQDAYTKWGLVAVAGIVTFGLVVFTLRALVNEIRSRKFLAMAHQAPAPSGSALDTPDPFGDHRLIKRPLRYAGDTFTCTDNAGDVVCAVVAAKRGWQFHVRDINGNAILEVHVLSRQKSFAFYGGAPSRLVVRDDGADVARLRRKFSFSGPVYDIDCLRPEPRWYAFRDNGLYYEERLVGRVYAVRGNLYLDIEKIHFHKAILGLFVAMR